MTTKTWLLNRIQNDLIEAKGCLRRAEKDGFSKKDNEPEELYVEQLQKALWLVAQSPTSEPEGTF